MSTTPRATVKRSLADLVPRYMRNRRDDIDAARTALARADFGAVKRIGHRLKGSGSGYGFHDITALGTQLEQASLQGDAITAARLIDALDSYLKCVQIDIV